MSEERKVMLETLSRLRKEREESESAQAEARRIASQLPEIRRTGTIAIMIPRKGGEPVGDDAKAKGS